MIQELFSLEGKKALVIGASKGLGKSMVLALASAGATVALASRSAGLIETISRDINSRGGEAIAVETDISKEEDIERMTAEVIERFGEINILINNAGVYKPGRAIELSTDDWDTTINVNLRGLFLCCRIVGKQMVKQKNGKIINIASVLGKRAAQTSSAYSASKAGIIQLTKSLALELAPHHINVNAIAPGWFETEMVEDELGDPRTRKYFLSKTPLGRFGEPEELGGTAVYLASKASDFMTGETIFIDGGISIW